MSAQLASVSLEDKYVSTSGRVYLSGIQALVRLLIMQRQRDIAVGLNTGGFVSGYRGSPLGGLDKALVWARKHLESNQIKFVPGVNEDLAATAVWGTQQNKLIGPSEYDGVVAMWYLTEVLLHNGLVEDVADADDDNPPDSMHALRAKRYLVASETD